MLARALPFNDDRRPPLTKTAICKAIVLSETGSIFQLTWPLSIRSEELDQLTQLLEEKCAGERDRGGRSDYREWRRLAFIMINKMSDEDKEGLLGMMIDRLTNKLESGIKEILSLKDDEHRHHSLRSLVKSALDISCLVKAQHAQYRFYTCQPTMEGAIEFKAGCMEDEFGGDSPENEGTQVLASFTPLLMKTGDTGGKQVRFVVNRRTESTDLCQQHLQNVICKAKVCCAAGPLVPISYNPNGDEDVTDECDDELLLNVS